ncbi:hypothetical protein BC941DRAFT_508341 [Chlamydoabsidia padenii]|nr:hypothetical protein BC941DRAFT_508341 [Chlamydoabsidia padenii]
MTLILTETCHYALLVAIEEGAGFPSLRDHEIFIHSRLALHLPNTVGDLIPPPTIISARPTQLVSHPQWRTTLVYFLSAKLLRRLRRRQALVTLQITAMSEQCDTLDLGAATLRVDEAKMIKMTQQDQKPPLATLKNFVVDKGEWKPIRGGKAQIKAGLFIVDMPPPAGERQKQVATPLRHPISLDKEEEEDLGFEIYSADTSDCLTTHSSSSSASSSTDIGHDIPIIEQQQQQQQQQLRRKRTTSSSSSPLEKYIINNNKKLWSTTAATAEVTTATTPSSSSSSTSSSSSSSLSPSPTLLPPLSIIKDLTVKPCKIGQLPYLQIGNGLNRYTFMLRIVEATAVMSLIPPSLGTRKSIQYTFAEWQIRHHVVIKGNAWQVIEPPMCLSLQGHLQDIQHWLTQQGQIDVHLVINDLASSKHEHVIGKSVIRLKGWCPLGIEQASFPIHDRFKQLHIDPPYQLAGVSVQLGLMDGWGNNDDDGKRVVANGISNSGSDATLVQQQQQQHGQFLQSIK